MRDHGGVGAARRRPDHRDHRDGRNHPRPQPRHPQPSTAATQKLALYATYIGAATRADQNERERPAQTQEDP